MHFSEIELKDNRKPVKELAKSMLKAHGKKRSLWAIEEAIDNKRREKYTSLGVMVWVEELEYLKSVKNYIESRS